MTCCVPIDTKSVRPVLRRTGLLKTRRWHGQVNCLTEILRERESERTRERETEKEMKRDKGQRIHLESEETDGQQERWSNSTDTRRIHTAATMFHSDFTMRVLLSASPQCADSQDIASHLGAGEMWDRILSSFRRVGASEEFVRRAYFLPRVDISWIHFLVRKITDSCQSPGASKLHNSQSVGYHYPFYMNRLLALLLASIHPDHRGYCIRKDYRKRKQCQWFLMRRFLFLHTLCPTSVVRTTLPYPQATAPSQSRTDLAHPAVRPQHEMSTTPFVRRGQESNSQ